MIPVVQLSEYEKCVGDSLMQLRGAQVCTTKYNKSLFYF